jgi:hypothetical protein
MFVKLSFLFLFLFHSKQGIIPTWSVHIFKISMPLPFGLTSSWTLEGNSKLYLGLIIYLPFSIGDLNYKAFLIDFRMLLTNKKR